MIQVCPTLYRRFGPGGTSGPVEIVWPDPDNKPEAVAIDTGLLEEMIAAFNDHCVQDWA